MKIRFGPQLIGLVIGMIVGWLVPTINIEHRNSFAEERAHILLIIGGAIFGAFAGAIYDISRSGFPTLSWRRKSTLLAFAAIMIAGAILLAELVMLSAVAKG
jgi:NhaP-type Na+/H+ or K+/H+ antiporter